MQDMIISLESSFHVFFEGADKNSYFVQGAPRLTQTHLKLSLIVGKLFHHFSFFVDIVEGGRVYLKCKWCIC